MSNIIIRDTVIEVTQKKIKNLHLRICPPNGTVRVSAPLRMKTDIIRAFVISKLDWIKRHQKKIQQKTEMQRLSWDPEGYYLWGKRYLLPSEKKKQKMIELECRKQLKAEIARLIAKWQPILGVVVQRFCIQQMKTRWGTCNVLTASLRFNTDLAKRPPIYLEYVVVHEMVHLLEPTHNHRFVAFMDEFLPNWRSYRKELNQLPLGYEEWQHEKLPELGLPNRLLSAVS